MRFFMDRLTLDHTTLNQAELIEAIDELRSLRDCLRWAASQFQRAELSFGHGTDNAFDEALFLIMHAIDLPWDAAGDVLDCRLTRTERERALNLVYERVNQRCPAPYLTGEAWFAGLPFYVDARVLVPRSPIAELIEYRFEPWLSNSPSRILDLCCGSGCIGIACAVEFDEAVVDVADISSDALDVAAINRERHQLNEHVHLFESDLFDALPQQTYDLIVSNPPYVDQEDIDAMPGEYHAEPLLGLAAGEAGLDIVLRLLQQAPDYLSPNGILIVEVGNSCVALQQQLPAMPFTWLEFERGGHGVFLLQRQDLVRGLQESAN